LFSPSLVLLHKDCAGPAGFFRGAEALLSFFHLLNNLTVFFAFFL
jgi:hypothetical protein